MRRSNVQNLAPDWCSKWVESLSEGRKSPGEQCWAPGAKGTVKRSGYALGFGARWITNIKPMLPM